MKTFKATLPASVAIKVQGIVSDIESDTFHADAIDAIWIYGVRRWVQDNINSAAKAARDNDEAFDAESALAARIAQAVSGEITTRTGGTAEHPLESYRRRVVRANLRGELKAQYDAIDSTDRKARDEFLSTIAAAHADTVDPAAQALYDADQSAKSLDVAFTA